MRLVHRHKLDHRDRVCALPVLAVDLERDDIAGTELKEREPHRLRVNQRLAPPDRPVVAGATEHRPLRELAERVRRASLVPDRARDLREHLLLVVVGGVVAGPDVGGIAHVGAGGDHLAPDALQTVRGQVAAVLVGLIHLLALDDILGAHKVSPEWLVLKPALAVEDDVLGPLPAFAASLEMTWRLPVSVVVLTARMCADSCHLSPEPSELRRTRPEMNDYVRISFTIGITVELNADADNEAFTLIPRRPCPL